MRAFSKRRMALLEKVKSERREVAKLKIKLADRIISLKRAVKKYADYEDNFRMKRGHSHDDRFKRDRLDLLSRSESDTVRRTEEFVHEFKE